MLSMTAGRHPGELVPSFPLPTTRVGLGLRGSLVALPSSPTGLGRSSVLAVLVTSFVEVVVVVRVAVVLLWRPKSPRCLVPRS